MILTIALNLCYSVFYSLLIHREVRASISLVLAVNAKMTFRLARGMNVTSACGKYLNRQHAYQDSAALAHCPTFPSQWSLVFQARS